MKIEYETENIRLFILEDIATTRHYVRLKSNRQLRKDLDKVMRIMTTVRSCQELTQYKALNYEHLKYDLSGLSSVRLGFKTKFRLIFKETDKGIKINIIEISEHYGDK
ncbi:MAG: hypothetical protein K2K64_08105 [Muribaculaceae bacterium]|nr:hypothetical protein [Muribaculaceae bacterium]